MNQFFQNVYTSMGLFKIQIAQLRRGFTLVFPRVFDVSNAVSKIALKVGNAWEPYLSFMIS